MRLAIDVLAVVDVGPLIRECRFHRGVRERMEHDSAPEDLRRRLLRIARDLLGILPPQLAIEDEELLDVRSLRVHLVRRLENRRHHAVEELVVERNAAFLEWLWERHAIEVAARAV